MKRPARVLIALALGLGAAVVALELTLRTFDGLMPERALLKLHWKELLEGNETRSIADPELGFRFRPSTRGEYALSDLSFEYETDEHGFRNPSPWPARAEIVVVGDSLAFGFGAPKGAQWAQLVRDGLESARLVNLALPGYCPAQYARAYEKYGVELAPELLIVCLFPTNDVKDQGVFLSWVADGAEGNFDVVRFAGRGRAGFLKSSYLAQFMAEKQAARNRGYESVTLSLDDGPMTLVPSQIHTSARASKRGTPQFQAVVRTLSDLHVRAREAGTRVLVVLFPCKEEVYLPGLGLATPEPVAPFAELCREREWNFVDLTPIFAERAAAKERLYFEIDGHPDLRGNRLTADALLAWIRANMPELR